MYSIGVIGGYDHVCGFMALGFETRSVDNKSQALEALERMAKECGVIFITEDYYEILRAECDKYNRALVPAVIPIPAGKKGNYEKRLSEYVEQAVGADIL